MTDLQRFPNAISATESRYFRLARWALLAVMVGALLLVAAGGGKEPWMTLTVAGSLLPLMAYIAFWPCPRCRIAFTRSRSGRFGFGSSPVYRAA